MEVERDNSSDPDEDVFGALTRHLVKRKEKGKGKGKGKSTSPLSANVDRAGVPFNTGVGDAPAKSCKKRKRGDKATEMELYWKSKTVNEKKINKIEMEIKKIELEKMKVELRIKKQEEELNNIRLVEARTNAATPSFNYDRKFIFSHFILKNLVKDFLFSKNYLTNYIQSFSLLPYYICFVKMNFLS